MKNERYFKNKIEAIKKAIATGRMKKDTIALKEAYAEFEKWSNKN